MQISGQPVDFSVLPYELEVKLSFSTNLKGDIDSVAVPLEPTVKPIVFTRAASQEIRHRPKSGER